ncbi:MAG: hypothetical protein SPL13_00990 [Clostridia bacterium]|nr:hypothetical protein [Clostridia bacterium]
MAEWEEKDHPRDGNNQKFVKKGSDGAYNSQENKAKALAQKVDERHKNTGIIKKKKSIRTHYKVIEKHKDKINNPAKYVKDWDKKSEVYKNGAFVFWRKEIQREEREISKIKNEIGESND